MHHAYSIANQYIHRVNCHLSELHPHIVADAFYNGEIENEIRQLVREGWKFTNFSFKNDSDRERLMEVIESIRCERIYPHYECTAECKERGTKQLDQNIHHLYTA